MSNVIHLQFLVNYPIRPFYMAGLRNDSV